jgi:hypothetical protein
VTRSRFVASTASLAVRLQLRLSSLHVADDDLVSFSHHGFVGHNGFVQLVERSVWEHAQPL